MRKINKSNLKDVSKEMNGEKAEPTKKDEDNIDLCLVVSHGKVFAGRFRENADPDLEDSLINAVELLTMVDPNQGLMIIGNRFGDIFIPVEALVATMGKDSGYYEAYFKTVTNLEIL